MSVKEIGCCGAYCRTCRALGVCPGCKLGYENGRRDIGKARCKIKICCIKRECQTCADCWKYSSCSLINNLYAKKGYKYEKYKQALEFIRNHGYSAFVQIANHWENVYGQYKLKND